MPRSITERQMEAMRAFAAELRREKAAPREKAGAHDTVRRSDAEKTSSTSREDIKARLAEAAPQVRDLLKDFEETKVESGFAEAGAAASSSSERQDFEHLEDIFVDAENNAPTIGEEDLASPPEALQQDDAAIEPAFESPAPTVQIRTAYANDDAAWVAANLRCENGKPYRDVANVVRILMQHPDFVGRFWFNKAMVKVVDRGTIMLDWQVDALAADLQERFLPEISEDVVGKAVVIAANRTDRFAK